MQFKKIRKKGKRKRKKKESEKNTDDFDVSVPELVPINNHH